MLQGKWSWGYISNYINIQEVINHPHKPWSKEGLSLHRDISLSVIDTVMPNTTDEWNWKYISKYINIREVINNPNRTWDRDGLSWNKGITIYLIDTLVLPNATGKWNWRCISCSISIQEVGKYPQRPWDRNNLSLNKGLTIEIMSLFDHGYIHELQHLYYPKIQYRDSYLCDIDILCIS